MFSILFLLAFIAYGVIALIVFGYVQFFRKKNLVGLLYFAIAGLVLWSAVKVGRDMRQLADREINAVVSAHP